MAVNGLRLIVYLQVAYYCVYGTTLPLPSELEGNSETTVDTTTGLSATPEVSETIGNIDVTTSISTRLSSSIPTTELLTTSVVSNITSVEELSSTQSPTVQSTQATTESTTSSVTSLPTDVSTSMTSSTSSNQSTSTTTGTISSSSVSSTSSSSISSQSQTTLSTTTQSPTTLSSTTTLSTTTQPPTTASSTTTQSPTTTSTSTTQSLTTTSSTTTQSPTTTTSSTTTQSPTTTSITTTQSPTTTSSTTTQLPTTTSSTTTQSPTTTSSTTTQSPTTTSSTTTQSPTQELSTTKSQTTTVSSTTKSTTLSSTTLQQSTTLLMTSPESQASSSSTPTQPTSTTSITPSTTTLSTTSTTTQTTPVLTTQRKISFQISLNVDETRNLSNTEEYDKVVDDSNNALTNLYMKQLGDKFSKVDIKSVRIGSLVIDHDVFVKNSPSVLVDVVNLMKSISNGKTNVTYNGNDASALSVSYMDSSNNQVLIDDKTDPAAVIESSYVCTSDQSCERIPTTTKDNKEDLLIIIISSVAGGVALLIIVAVVIIICARRKKPKEPVTTDRQYQHFLFSQQTTEILNKANNRQQSLGNESNTSRQQGSGSHYAKLGRVPSRPPDSYGLYERAEDQKSREPDVFVTTPSTNNWGMPYVPPLDNGERGNTRNRGADRSDQNRTIFTSTDAVKDDKFHNNEADPYRLGYNDRNTKNPTRQLISQGNRNSGYRSTLEATYLPNLETRQNETPVRRDNFQGPNYHSRENINSRELQRDERYSSKDRLGELNYRPPVGSRNQYSPGYDASRNPYRSDCGVRNPQTNSQPDLHKAGKRWYPGYDEYLAELDQSRAGNPKYDAPRGKHYNARGKHHNAHY